MNDEDYGFDWDSYYAANPDKKPLSRAEWKARAEAAEARHNELRDRYQRALDSLIAAERKVARVEAAIDSSLVSSEYGVHCVEVPALHAALADEETTDE